MGAKILICYSFQSISPTQRKQFDRKMFGTVERTHNGKYETKTKGILTSIEYRRPVRSVVIFDEKFKNKVLPVLEEFSAMIETYRVLPQ